MSMFQTTKDGDIVISSGSIALVTQGTETAMLVREKLKFIRGTWFLDITAGIPLFQEILGSGVDLNNIESIYKSAILSVDGVSQLTSFEMDYDSTLRQLDINWKAVTTDGNAIADKLAL